MIRLFHRRLILQQGDPVIASGDNTDVPRLSRGVAYRIDWLWTKNWFAVRWDNGTKGTYEEKDIIWVPAGNGFRRPAHNMAEAEPALATFGATIRAELLRKT